MSTDTDFLPNNYFLFFFYFCKKVMSALGHNKTRMCYNARDGLKGHFLGVARAGRSVELLA